MSDLIGKPPIVRITEFLYMNHRGEMAIRRLRIEALQFIRNPGYNYQAGWFLHGFDLDKHAPRSFALSRIILPDQPVVTITLGPTSKETSDAT